jgi:hypothetical protein
MARPHYALTILALAALAASAAAQTSVLPQAGVLVLRNGHVLEGEITRAGDFYVVTQGQGSEVKLDANLVELFCGSLLEAYDFKAAHASSFSVKSRLDLAKWCLRQGLQEQCAEQLAIAANIEPGSSQVKEMEARLKVLQESPPPPVAIQHAGIAAAELEDAIRALPRGSVEKFGAVIQPILLNRCGANQCHGPNAKSDFRLLRPPQGQIVSKRFTQRNLYASLKYLDRTNPDNSPLVVLPLQRHGNSLAPVFDKHSMNQFAELVTWARLTTGSSAVPQPVAAAPATITPVNATLSQPTTKPGSSPPPTPDASEPPAGTVGMRVMRPPLDDPSKTRPKAAPKQPEFRDRFDPEIFNRQYYQK